MVGDEFELFQHQVNSRPPTNLPAFDHDDVRNFLRAVPHLVQHPPSGAFLAQTFRNDSSFLKTLIRIPLREWVFRSFLRRQILQLFRNSNSNAKFITRGLVILAGTVWSSLKSRDAFRNMYLDMPSYMYVVHLVTQVILTIIAERWGTVVSSILSIVVLTIIAESTKKQLASYTTEVNTKFRHLYLDLEKNLAENNTPALMQTVNEIGDTLSIIREVQELDSTFRSDNPLGIKLINILWTFDPSDTRLQLAYGPQDTGYDGRVRMKMLMNRVLRRLKLNDLPRRYR